MATTNSPAEQNPATDPELPQPDAPETIESRDPAPVGDEATDAAKEAEHQIEESKLHAEQFAAVLAKAEKRFNALKKVEERHANAYKKVLEAL